MDKQKVLNPLTGRMIDANGATAKSIKQKKGKVSVLEAAIKRKLTKPPEPPKPAPKPAPVPGTKTKRTYITKKKKEEASKVLQGAVKRTLAKKPEPPKPAPETKTKRTYITKKKKEEASKVLQGAVKRTLAKKPEPPKPASKKFGFEDLDEDVKGIISKYVRGDDTFTKDRKDLLNKTLPLNRFHFKDNLANGITPTHIAKYFKDQFGSRYPDGLTTYFKTYTRADRVKILSKVSEKELDRLGGIKYYPLLCIYNDDMNVNLWVLGGETDDIISSISNYYDGHILLPDGNILYYDENDPDPDIWEMLFGNENLRIDLSNKRIYDLENEELPTFALPKISQKAINKYFDEYFDGSDVYEKKDWDNL